MRPPPQARIAKSCWTTPRRRRTARTSADSTSRNSSSGRSRRRRGRHVTRRERFFYRGRQRGPWGRPMVFASYPDVAALVGRVALGALFLAHGWPKIKDVKKPIGFVKGTGWPGGAVFALLFALLEFFGSLALSIGFLTQIVAVLFVLEMTATTIFSKTKLKRKFVLGYELDVAYAAFALVLAFLGPGAWSLDHLLGWA